MKTIDHASKKKRPTNWWVDWALWPMIALFWLGYFVFHEPDWLALSLGGLTGMVFAYWVVDLSGNKFFLSAVPEKEPTDRR